MRNWIELNQRCVRISVDNDVIGLLNLATSDKTHSSESWHRALGEHKPPNGPLYSMSAHPVNMMANTDTILNLGMKFHQTKVWLE